MRCLGVAPRVAVNILHVSLFVDRFIREIFPSELKIVPCHSHTAAILARRRPFAAAATNLLNPALSDGTTRKTVHKNLKTNPIKIVKQNIIPLRTAAQVLVTITASKLLLIQPHFQSFSHHTTLTPRRTMDAPPRVTFYTTVSNFSDIPQHLKKHMVIAPTDPLTPTIQHCQQTPHTPSL